MYGPGHLSMEFDPNADYKCEPDNYDDGSEDYDDGPDNCEDDFPELDPGFCDEDSGRWRKPASPVEKNVYETVTPHPRILAYRGIADYVYLDLDFHPNGDLWTYLVDEKPALATRIDWAIEIAEGLAQLHSKSVVWADAHFRNVLVTDDLHLVLADFAYSVMLPSLIVPARSAGHNFTTVPPPVFACPRGHWGSRSSAYVDIFGFGIMLFALLLNRFPWTTSLVPTWDEQETAMNNNDTMKFDTLDDPDLKKIFGPVLDKCFEVKYLTGTELLEELALARENWLSQRVATAN
ncbi:kinase-like domain-containing protein [Mycena vitilis]|nr:kinase-like domain-containing protein [Mycena vitilis]